jgi:SAM-dependent methyltransferase|tara:strand:- start:281 stop:877 length:597 start_codon:yes stop_codon:yes gene_type:complete
MTDARTIAVYNARAEAYAAMGPDKPQRDLAQFIDGLPTQGNVLDVGCGPGTAAVQMVAAGLRVDAIDASAAMVQLAQSKGVAARIATFDDITGADIYDGVWASFSLLHARATDLPRYIAAIARALRPGGLFHIAMKTGEGEQRDSIDRLYTFVTKPQLNALLTDAGLTPVFTRTGVDKGLAGTDDAYLVIQARKDADA